MGNTRRNWMTKHAGEIAARMLNIKAYGVYVGMSPLDIYEYDTEDGKRYDMTGCIEREGMTFEYMEAMLEEYSDESEYRDEDYESVTFEAEDVNDPGWDIIIKKLKETIPDFKVEYTDGNWMTFKMPKK